MKLGITSKVFLAVLATAVLVTLAMGGAARVSFTRGFLGYLNEQGVERIEALAPAVAMAYQEHGSWDFLRNNVRNWLRLLRPAPPRGPFVLEQQQPSESDLLGVDLRLAVLDAQHRVVIGHSLASADSFTHPIEVNGATVGWLAVVPFQEVTERADVRFQQRQFRATWIVGALSVLLAAIVALWLARMVLRPVKQIADATHRLAAGDYATRLQVSSRDEIGRLAEDFNHLAHALERNEQMRRSFMADVSHELRTPLSVLRGELEAIEDGVRSLTPESLRSLQGEVDTLSKLVSNLYDLSLSDVGALTYRKVNVDVREVLERSLNAFRARLADRQIDLDQRLPPEELVVMADDGRLQQLFNNLLENSVRYTDPGGLVRVDCRRDGDRVVIDFQDSEPGVPDELLPKLFERFYRVEGSRNRASGGAGLGLAICRNIVEAHSGSIEARQSPLGGVRIVISLPLTSPRP